MSGFTGLIFDLIYENIHDAIKQHKMKGKQPELPLAIHKFTWENNDGKQIYVKQNEQ